MLTVKEKVKNYLSDDSAVDGSVEKIMYIVIAIGCAMMVGWYIWNTLKKHTESSSCDSSDSPWCTE